MTRRFKSRRIAVLGGGLSSERAVSQNTARAIAKALGSRGYDVVEIDADRDLAQRLFEVAPEAVYIALHGTYGEDGRLQGMLDWLGIPYTGESLRVSLLAFDKVLAKAIFRAAGVPVARDVSWTVAQAAGKTLADVPFGVPCVVKPVAEGSSVGVYIVKQPEDFDAALAAVAALGPVLIEAFVEGVELSVPILSDAALGVVEVEAAVGFYDYEAKYGDAGTRYHLPPRIEAAAVVEVERVALAAHRALGCRGATRVDVLLGPDGPVVLELNTLPGMTATSLVPKVAAAKGIPFAELTEIILDCAAWGPDEEGDRYGA